MCCPLFVSISKGTFSDPKSPRKRYMRNYLIAKRLAKRAVWASKTGRFIMQNGSFCSAERAVLKNSPTRGRFSRTAEARKRRPKGFTVTVAARASPPAHDPKAGPAAEMKTYTKSAAFYFVNQQKNPIFAYDRPQCADTAAGRMVRLTQLQHKQNIMKTNYEIRYAAHPEDAKSYDTKRIRRDFLIEKVFAADEVNMVYSMYDRMIVGGAMPVNEELKLEAIDPLKADYFTTRREVGIFNVGQGEGTVKVGDETFTLGYKEALYIGRGDRDVVFCSADPKKPAKFYFNSVTAHKEYPCKKVTKADAVVAHMGALETSNERDINKMLVSQVLPTCQLQMGMTELAPGSVWNTMPAHVHSRRMEAYFYFEVPEEQAVCHFMGEVDETRHIWMQNDQAVLSPEWSIHSAAATHNYTFIWGMGGENLDYGDQDFSKITDLK